MSDQSAAQASDRTSQIRTSQNIQSEGAELIARATNAGTIAAWIAIVVGLAIAAFGSIGRGEEPAQTPTQKPAATQKNAPTQKLTDREPIRQLHAIAQEHRRARAKPPQELDEDCCRVAQAWAEHMARTGRFHHGGGEQIIAMGQGSPAAAMAAWKASGGHNRWLLSGTARAGWGFARSASGTCYWAGCFASAGSPIDGGRAAEPAEPAEPASDAEAKPRRPYRTTPRRMLRTVWRTVWR